MWVWWKKKLLKKTEGKCGRCIYLWSGFSLNEFYLSLLKNINFVWLGGRASGSSSMKRSTSSEPDLLPNPNMFNPFSPGFYPDFAAGFPGLPLSMLNLLPPERHVPSMHGMQIDEDCKSDRSKQSLEDDYPMPQSMPLNRDDRRELIQHNGQDWKI